MDCLVLIWRAIFQETQRPIQGLSSSKSGCLAAEVEWILNQRLLLQRTKCKVLWSFCHALTKLCQTGWADNIFFNVFHSRYLKHWKHLIHSHYYITERTRVHMTSSIWIHVCSRLCNIVRTEYFVDFSLKQGLHDPFPLISHPTNTPLQPGQLFEPYARLQQHPCAGSPDQQGSGGQNSPASAGEHRPRWKSPAACTRWNLGSFRVSRFRSSPRGSAPHCRTLVMEIDGEIYFFDVVADSL